MTLLISSGCIFYGAMTLAMAITFKPTHDSNTARFLSYLFLLTSSLLLAGMLAVRLLQGFSWYDLASFCGLVLACFGLAILCRRIWSSTSAMRSTTESENYSHFWIALTLIAVSFSVGWLGSLLLDGMNSTGGSLSIASVGAIAAGLLLILLLIMRSHDAGHAYPTRLLNGLAYVGVAVLGIAAGALVQTGMSDRQNMMSLILAFVFLTIAVLSVAAVGRIETRPKSDNASPHPTTSA